MLMLSIQQTNFVETLVHLYGEGISFVRDNRLSSYTL